MQTVIMTAFNSSGTIAQLFEMTKFTYCLKNRLAIKLDNFYNFEAFFQVVGKLLL